MSWCDSEKKKANSNGDPPAGEEIKTVPLALSSLAHVMCLPRSEENVGVLEGLLSVVHHTLSEVSSHATAPIQATPWILIKEIKQMELSSQKGLPFSYSKHSFLHIGDQIPLVTDPSNWSTTCDTSIVGRVSLYYASSHDDVTSDDDEDMQQALLMRAVVEYRSQPSKGSIQLRKQEELSLTSFGNGSVDDNVKLGALSSLHDDAGKYVLKITSVRNNTYCYNVDDITSMAKVTVATQEAPQGRPPLTRLELTLEDSSSSQDVLHPLAFPSTQLERHFLVWDDAPVRAKALPSQQTLLLQKQGMYINGRLMQHSELLPSLFGFNLDGIAAWHGHVQDYEAVKHAYATLWQEVMIDARLVKLNIASTLLDRLMNGLEEDDDDEDYEDTTNVECLESHLMASPIYDPVGICAKALATRFAQEFGTLAVPCLANQVEWFKSRMGHKIPVIVPQRVLNILRRGGYFDLQRDTNEVWFMENVRAAQEGDESRIVEVALQLLSEAGCDDAPKIMFVKVDAADPIKNKYMCRYSDELVQYHVNEAVWGVAKPALAIAMYVAQECPDGNVLLNLVSKQSQQAE